MAKVFDNPLINPIQKLLSTTGLSISEHQLIKQLQHEIDAFPQLADSPGLALFQTHFLIMNALYQLQEELLGENIHLQISPLAIGLQETGDADGSALAEADSHEALKRHYTDWSHFQLTDEQEVDNLLAKFWQHYLVQDKQADAYQTLKLDPGAGWESVKKAYRRLASDYHPDRGGDPATFVSIRQAYEVLARSLGSTSR